MNAQPSLFDAPPKRRKASIQDALDILRARGSLGLTEREWEDIAHRQRLAGRIGELRQEFGDGAVESLLSGAWVNRSVLNPATGHSIRRS